MKNIKLFDVSKENEEIREIFFSGLESLYSESNFTLGYQNGPVEELESKLGKYCGRKYALGVNSGTFALEMASYALNIKEGDEVIVPVNTFVATASAPALRGAKIVPADVDLHTYNISLDTVQHLVNDNTKAIFGVNMYGNPFPFKDLESLGVKIVEDAAHSHGSELDKNKSGSFGDISTLSFFPTKVFGGIGDSGLLLHDDDKLDSDLRAYRNCGQSKPHFAINLASVGRMPTIQAQFLLAKFEILDKLLAHRRKIAEIYDNFFAGSKIKPQVIDKNACSSYFAYVVRVEDRDKVVENLKDYNIPTTIQYRYLLTEQPFWNKLKHKKNPTPNAKNILESMFSLPMNYSVTTSQAEYIASKLLEIVK